MKSKKVVSVFMILCLWGNLSLAQNRTYEEIAYEYLKKHLNVESPGQGISKSGETKYHKLPKGNMLVDMTITHSINYVEELHATNGNYFAQANGIGSVTYSDKAYKKREINSSCGYLVFISKDGTPLKYVKRPNYFAIRTWNDYVWLFIDQHDYDVDGYRIGVFDYIYCYSIEGEPIWKMKDMMVFDASATEHTLYLAGEYVGGEVARSLFRTVDLHTMAIEDKCGEKGDIDYNMEMTGEGIKVARHKDNGQKTSLVFPYSVSDKDYQFKLIMKSYDHNNPSDQVAIGERYLSGRGFDKDERKAFDWFQKAANQNNDIGMSKLADCYIRGIGVAQDLGKAISLYEKSANLDNTDAMIALSDIYAEGNGIEKNMSKALYWKEKLAFKGNMSAQKYILAHQTVEYEKIDLTADEAYKMGYNCLKEKQFEWAKFCLERAINLGSKDAMLILGEWLYLGGGISKDYDRAIEMLSTLGEEDNNKYAQKVLGLIYHENNGVAPDVKKEMYWVAKSAENGDVDSQMRLGYAYQNGIGVKKNKKLAFDMFEKAATHGNQAAIMEMVKCHATGYGTKKDNYSSLAWFCKMNDANKQIVADNYFHGNGVKQNLNLATMMYQDMSDKGDIKATKKLALCYLYGIGVKEDIYTAYNMAMKVRNTTHDGKDGDIYYIEAKYFENKNKYTFKPSGAVIESYRRAIRNGCNRAKDDFERYQRKFGLKLDINDSSY